MTKRTLTTFFLLFLGLNFSVLAQGKESKAKMVNVKCHVELIGGGETIYSRVINENSLASLPLRLVNQSISTSLSNKKKRVYKVNECTLSTSEFKTAQAKLIDKKTAR